MRTPAIWATALTAAIGSSSLRAHHSATMFELAKSVWLEGTVVSYEPINPHARITVDVKGADGQVQRWTVEGPSLNRFEQRGLSAELLKAGDAVEVCGFQLKDDVRARVEREYARPYPQLFVHGHLLVTQDGQKRYWGSYGILANCVRAEDTAETWLSFVNGPGRDLWCRGRTVSWSVASAAPPAVVAEIDRRMATPCN